MRSGNRSPPISGFSRALSRAQRVSAPRHSSGISESTSMRARTSSLRLVSCVEEASIVCGQSRARAALRAWNAGTIEAEVDRVAADLVERDEAVVDVERRVLDALRHHRAGDLLELHHEGEQLRAVLRAETFDIAQEQRIAEEIEELARRARVAPLRLRDRLLDVLRVVVRDRLGAVRRVGAVDRQAGDHLAEGEGEAVEREIAVAAVALRDALQLVG